MKLIDKDKVTEEIEKLKDKGKYNEEYDCAYRDGINAALHILKKRLDSLEVKEVDLEKEIKNYFDSQPIITRSKGIDYRLIPTGVDIAKHFFELGLKAAQKEE